MRYTVTSELDPELFAEVERERRSAGLSRSAAIRQALAWWIVQRKERGEERVSRAEGRHRQLMNRLDFIVGMIREQEKRVARRRSRQDDRSRQENGSRQAMWPEEEPQLEPEREGGALDEARKRARRRFQ